MANEFIARKGLIVNGVSQLSGSVLVQGNVSASSYTGSLFGSSSFATSASFVTTLNQTVSASGNIAAGTNLVSNFSSGDEGGEINLARPQTNNSISGSVTIDVYQNKVRIFESNSPNRGGFFDISSLGSGVSTNLAGGAGTVTSVTAGNGLTGGTITGAGTITLDTGSAHFTSGVVKALPTGTVSSSAQINTGSFSGSITTASFATIASGLNGGTTNYIPLWSSATQQSSSAIFQSAGNIGIGTAAPGARLDVNGNANINGNVTLLTNLYLTNTLTRISTDGSGEVGINFNSNATSTNNLAVYNGSSATLFAVARTSGNVFISGGLGIGNGVSSTERVLVYSNADSRNKVRILNDSSGSSARSEIVVNAFGNSWGIGMGSAANNSNAFYIREDSNSADTQRFTILTGGNVGIGTTSPTNKLQIGSMGSSGFGGNDLAIGNGTQVMAFYNYSGGPSTWFTNTNFALMNAGGTGNVGIGTTSPQTKLHVAGDFRFGSNTTYTDLRLFTDSPLSGYNQTNAITPTTIPGGGTAIAGLYLKNAISGAGTTRIDLLVDGNVGIGTSNPDANLTVFGQASFNSGSLSNPGVAARGDLNTGMYFPSADTIGFVEGGVEAMRIDSSGNVGVGTSSPTSILHVAQSVTTGSVVATFDNTHHSTSTAHTVEHNFRFRRDGGQQLDGAIIRVGKEGTWAGVGSETKAYLSFLTRPDFTTASLERVRITSTGTVGIGTSTPGATLHVQGNVSASSYTGSFSGSLSGTATSASFASTAPYSGLTGVPTGIVSSSTQINNYNVFATTGSNTFNANQTITGSLIITQNLTVLGSSSVSFVSQSTLNIGTNLITVNVQNPAVRFGGLAVIDSGSSPQRSGSLFFDSTNDQWIFVHQNTAGGVTSSILVMGPPTFNNVGNETLLTQNRVLKGGGLEHIVDSQITDDGSVVSITNALNVGTSVTASAGNITTLRSTTVSASGGISGSGLFVTNEVVGNNFRSATTSYYFNPTTGLFNILNGYIGAIYSPGSVLRVSFSDAASTFSGNVIATSITSSVSGALAGTFPYPSLTNVPVGIVSSSGQISYLGLSNIPVGIISSSTQINALSGVSASFASTASGLTGGTANYIPLWTSGTQQSSSAIFQSTGNIGVGTSSPTQRLDVSGSIKAGNGNTTGLLVSATGTATTQAAIAIQQLTSEGDTIIFADYEPFAEYGIIARNSIDSIDFTAGTSTGNLTNYNITNRTGNSRTAYVKTRISLGDGNMYVGGNVGVSVTAPVAKLHVLETAGGTGNINLGILVQGAGGSSFNTGQVIGFIGTSGNTAYSYVGGRIDAGGAGDNAQALVFGTNATNTAPTEKMRITSAGNVGIGTTAPDANLTVQGQASFNSGSLTNPGIAARGDLNTGIYFPSADTIGFVEGGVEVMRIDSSGRVGIGTTAPQSILDVITPVNGYASFGVQMSVGQYSGIHFGYREGNTSYRKSAVVFERTDNSGAGSNAAGKVHILNGPQAGAGSATLSDAALTIAENRNIGIGTMLPSASLHISGANNTNALRLDIGPSARYIFNANSTSLYSTTGSMSDTGLLIGHDSTIRDFRLQTGNTPRLTILGGGNVGIGTTNPLELLHISNLSANTVVRIGNNGATDQLIYFNGAADWSMGIDTSDANAFKLSRFSSLGTNDIITVTTGSNVGIGTTSPTKLLHVADTGLIDREGIITSRELHNVGFGVDRTGTNWGMGFYVDGVKKALLDGNNGWGIGSNSSYISGNPPANGMIIEGNVGIGTTVPGATLHVQGAISSSTIRTSTSANVLANSFTAGFASGARVIDATSPAFELWHDGSSVGQFLFSSNVLRYGVHSGNGVLTERLRIDSSGNVGIGATSLNSLLHLRSASPVLRIDSTNPANNSELKLTYNNDDNHGLLLRYIGNSAVSFIDNTYPATVSQQYGDIQFRQNVSSSLSARMIIKADGGNVGIGTTTPGARLDVVNTAGAVTSRVRSTFSNAYFIIDRQDTSSEGFLRFATNTSNIWTLGLKDNTNTLYFNNGTDRVAINSSGNVGIGTTAPGTTLHVQGNISASFITGSAIYVSSSLGELLSQTSSSMAVGDIFYDTNITVSSLSGDGPSVYELLAQYNPNLSGSSTYRNILHGHIYIEQGWDGSQLVMSAEYNELYRAIASGSSDGSGANVNVSFVSASGAATAIESITVPFASSSWRMRIRFSNNSVPSAFPSYRYVRLMRKL